MKYLMTPVKISSNTSSLSMKLYICKTVAIRYTRLFHYLSHMMCESYIPSPYRFHGNTILSITIFKTVKMLIIVCVTTEIVQPHSVSGDINGVRSYNPLAYIISHSQQ